MSTPPTRRSSTYSTSVSSPLARRSSAIPSPSLLSPMNSMAGGTPNSYSSSIAPSQYLDGGRRFSTYSASGVSNVGSYTSNVTTTPQKFKRGHMRKKVPVLQTTVNSEELDLNSLTDPDDLFRMFGVREVRGLEKRAKDAAATKVSDLRTMVGERYRDLLSAADSIVRMRLSAEKLVEKLEKVGTGIGGAAGDSPSKRGANQLTSKRSNSPEPDRSLQSPATLSLTIHLFLSLPSLVHTLLESSSFLPAARLEGVGRVVYRELSTFPFGADEEEGALKLAFPIVERQWESVGSLGTAITRRATSELQTWSASAATTAETLAAILMLENASLPSSLSLLLEARSKSLTSVLNSNTKSKHSQDITKVLSHLSEALGIVLKTVEIANEIFTPSKLYPEGILSLLLRQIENPSPIASSSSTSSAGIFELSPTLSSLPNYPLLLRHLSPSILDFTPFLSVDSPRNILAPNDAEAQISTWLKKETTRVVLGVTSWISDLKGGARTLAKVRTAVRAGFTSANSTTTSSATSDLLTQLEIVIESRLEAVYKTHLTTLVQRVSPCLRSLLTSLPNSKSDIDPVYFLFEEFLPFPSPAHYALPTRVVQHGIDPFDAFLIKVNKRVEGCSPLVEKGLSELEAHARDLREDLEGWLGGGGNGEGEVVGAKLRMQDQYVQSAGDTFDGVYKALSEVLEEVASDVTTSIFIGHFIFKLSQSETFTKDLLLGSAPIVKSREGFMTAEWESRLGELQSRSLIGWRKRAIDKASKSIQDSIKSIGSPLSNLTSWSWDATRAASELEIEALPTQPSSFILIALKVLSTAIRDIGPTRLENDQEIVVLLLAQFQNRCLELSQDLLKAIGTFELRDRKDVAIQSLWDVVFLKRFFEGDKVTEWKGIENQLLEMINLDNSIVNRIEQASLHYLQRTQTIFFPLLTPASLQINEQIRSESMSDNSRMLLWGNPPSGYEFKSSVGVVIPKARLGLLRE